MIISYLLTALLLMFWLSLFLMLAGLITFLRSSYIKRQRVETYYVLDRRYKNNRRPQYRPYTEAELKYKYSQAMAVRKKSYLYLKIGFISFPLIIIAVIIVNAFK